MAQIAFISIVGGGLAGSEAAWQIAEAGYHVHLYEMRPEVSTGAHVTANLAELVCSNSFGSTQSDRASGILLNELRKFNSLLLECAELTAVPGGNALAVDRSLFSQLVTEKISSHPKINLIRQEISEIPSGPSIISTGPLTSLSLSRSLINLTGMENQFFFDAVAPIVYSESINLEIAFRASRYDYDEQNKGDYINCPFTKEEYKSFIEALIDARTINLPPFEKYDNEHVELSPKYFEGCLPIEVLAKRGERALAFGPMRPIGLKDPLTGKGAYAICQLRQDNIAGDLYNLVGFQTNLTFSEQKRVFRMIPGLENVEFMRYGQMHRNIYIASPKLLHPTLQYRDKPDLFFAGQITGVEGYLGNIATGLLAGKNMVRLLEGLNPISFPRETMIGSLCYYITHAELKSFQPMKVNLGILPALPDYPSERKERAKLYSLRADRVMDEFVSNNK